MNIYGKNANILKNFLKIPKTPLKNTCLLEKNA